MRPMNLIKPPGMKRSDFLRLVSGGATLTAFLPPKLRAATRSKTYEPMEPVSIATWRFGLETTAEAMRVLTAGGSALDATEAGVKLCEADPKERSVQCVVK